MGWPARYRPTHRLTVAGETWKRSAARRTGQPSSNHQTGKTTAPLRGQRCVSVGHEGLRSAMRVCQPTSCRRPSHNLTPVHNLPRKYN